MIIIYLEKESDAMKIIVVEVCDANVLTTIDVETIIEDEFPEVAVIINQCLSFCGLCRSVPYAIVNNRRIFGKTPETCLDNIRQAIKEELTIFYS